MLKIPSCKVFSDYYTYTFHQFAVGKTSTRIICSISKANTVIGMKNFQTSLFIYMNNIILRLNLSIKFFIIQFLIWYSQINSGSYAVQDFIRLPATKYAWEFKIMHGGINVTLAYQIKRIQDLYSAKCENTTLVKLKLM